MKSAKTIKLTIGDKGAEGFPATILDQVKDAICLLESVDKSQDKDGEGGIQWLLKGMSMKSPLQITIVPAPTQQLAKSKVSQRASKVAQGLTKIMDHLESGESKSSSKGYDQASLGSLKRLIGRVHKESLATKFDFSEYGLFKPVIITKANVPQLSENAKKLKISKFIEFGSIEGYVKEVERMANKEPCVIIEERLHGQKIKCTFKKGSQKDLLDKTLDNLLKGMRVLFHGQISYKSRSDLEKVDHVIVEETKLFPPDSELPDIEDLYDPNYTEGEDPVAYIRKLRDD